MILVSSRFVVLLRATLCTLAISSLFAIPVFAQAPVSLWHGDRNTNDSIGGNNGVAHGGVTYDAGIVGSCFDFDGSTGGINIPDAPDLQFTKSMTVSAWVNPSALPDPSILWGQVVFRGDDRPGLDPYYFALSPYGYWVFAVDDANNDEARVTVDAALNQWILLTGTLDDATGLMTLYVDGEQVDQITTTIRPFAQLDPTANPGIEIGDSQDYPNSGYHMTFSGKIDEVALYNVALDPAVIRAKYARGVAVARLSLRPATVKGGAHATGTVTLNLAAPKGGEVIALTSSAPSIASVPSTVTVPAQATSATFTVTTTVVNQATPVTISASLHAKKGSTLTVTP